MTEKMKKLLSSLLFVVLSAAFAAFLTYLTGGSPQKILMVSGFTALLMAIGLLKSRYRKFDRAVETFFSKYFRFTFWVLVTLAPVVFFRWLAEFTVTTSPILQGILFVIWASLLTTILIFIATERKREKLFRFLERVGGLAPYIYCFNTFVIAALFFASLTYLMAGFDMLTFTNPDGNPITAAELSVAQLMDFFVWHFLDAVPLLKINETLNWKMQLAYASSAVGFIVLLFKIAVIIPVISAFRGYWQHRQTTSDGKETPEKS